MHFQSKKPKRHKKHMTKCQESKFKLSPNERRISLVCARTMIQRFISRRNERLLWPERDSAHLSTFIYTIFLSIKFGFFH